VVSLAPVLAPDELALRALYAAAIELPLESCQELARQINEFVVIRILDHDNELNMHSEGDRRMIAALRTVADAIGHPPSTTEYIAEYERRRQRGALQLPSVSTIVKHFDRWENGLAAAALVPGVPPSRTRRQAYRQSIYRYSDERLVEALRACTRELRRLPKVRDYQAWRADRLAGRPGKRLPLADIPDRRTLHNRYGSWSNALAAAGLNPAEHARTTVTHYSEL
jgi:hypothetical protein